MIPAEILRAATTVVMVIALSVVALKGPLRQFVPPCGSLTFFCIRAG